MEKCRRKRPSCPENNLVVYATKRETENCREAERIGDF